MHEEEKGLKYAALIIAYLKQELTASEEQVLNTWRAEDPAHERLFQELTADQLPAEELLFLNTIDTGSAWEKIKESQTQPVKRLFKHRYKWIAAAAIIFLAFGLGLYPVFFNKKNKPAEITLTPVTVIQPGGNKATLTLSDGSTILLDSTANGAVTTEGGTELIKSNGQISYHENKETTSPRFNTIRTPRGGQYQLILSDGTKIWLNAASSLHYPAGFSGQNRKVEMTGEAYFEVAKDPAHPFIVETDGMNVEVTGTHFNINAYTDENGSRATLIEGAVTITCPTGRLKLLPGEQAHVAPDGKINLQKEADIGEVMAWKNGQFIFNSADIKTIMRQISRWYNVEVAYAGVVSKETFSGIVSRQSNIATVLKIMETSGIHFRIEGNKVTVE